MVYDVCRSVGALLCCSFCGMLPMWIDRRLTCDVNVAPQQANRRQTAHRIVANGIGRSEAGLTPWMNRPDSRIVGRGGHGADRFLVLHISSLVYCRSLSDVLLVMLIDQRLILAP